MGRGKGTYSDEKMVYTGNKAKAMLCKFVFKVVFIPC